MPTHALDQSAAPPSGTSLTQLQQLLSAIGDGVNVVSTDGIILYVNKAYSEMFGYDEGELIGQNIAVVNAETERSAQETVREIISVLDAQGKWEGDLQNCRKDGSTFWTNAKIIAFESAEWGKVWVSVQRDISRQRQLLERLARDERQYKAIVQDQTEAICRFLPDGTFIFVNEVYCRIFGKPASELIGLKWHPVAHPDDRPMIERKLREISPDNPVVVIENRVRVFNGELRWMQFINRGLFDPDGQLKEIQSVGRDITVRRSIEERLELALAASGLGSFDWDLQTGKIIADKRCSEMLDFSPDELGDPNFWMGLLDPRENDRFERELATHLQGDSPILQNEHRLRHKDGHWVPVEIRARVSEHDQQGRPTRLVGTLQDITQRKRLNEEGVELLQRIETLIRESTSSLSAKPADNTALECLTKRERQVVSMIADGMTSAQIARQLHLATNTVITHRQRLMAKLDLHSTAEVTRFAIDHGLMKA